MSDKFIINSESVRALADVLNDTDLSEIEYEAGEHRVRLVKNAPVVAAPAVAAAPVAQAPAPVASAVEVVAEAPAANGEAVTSPMVGVAYMAPEPGAAPFVTVGSKVNVGDTLVIVEAMKVMNPIKATKAGTISEICVNDAEPVEFGQPLVRIA